MSQASNVVRLPRIPSLSWDDCRLLVGSVEDYAIFMLDPDGYVATWNIGAEKIKGYKASEIIGEHFSKFYPPEDVAAQKPENELLIASKEGRIEDEGWRVRKDGTRFWANVIITALRDETGTLRGFGKVTRDLTKRRLAEAELREAEERFRLLVDAVTDYAIYMLDPQGRVTTWNVGAERMKGYSADEILGKNFDVFFPKDDVASGKPVRELAIAVDQGRFEEEGFRIRKDGSRFWANVVLTPVRDSHGALRGFAKVTRDLTRHREAEETEKKLMREQAARSAAEASEAHLRESEDAARRSASRAEAAARRAEEANRVKDEFLATVSHELRTPLNAVLGWSSLLLTRGADPTISKAINVIHRNAQAQAKIIDDILDVSRIVTGKLRLELKPTNIIALVHEAIDVVRPSAAAKGISIELSPAGELALLIGDPERLRQVIWNLLSNAVKFTDKGGQITVQVEQDGSKLTVMVRDTGRGIDPEFLPYVFERFRQADSSTTRQFGGLGLGLAIVRHIVELHGGQVTAESEGKGQGSLFRVSLPVRAVIPPSPLEEEAESSQSRDSAVPERISLNGLRVLVVDDDADARDLLHAVLLSAGAVVETADSAAAGLDAIRRFRPQVLVSDVGMPGGDGYSFARRVRALPPAEGGGIPSIALTAYTRVEDRTKALSAGFTTHIGKPVSPDDLLAAVANLAAFSRR